MKVLKFQEQVLTLYKIPLKLNVLEFIFRNAAGLHLQSLLRNKHLLTLYRIGGSRKTPYQFFPCNLYKRRNKPPKHSDLWFWPYWSKIWRPYLMPVLNFWTSTLKTDHPSKNWSFWSNPYKIEVMTTFLIKFYRCQTLVTWQHLQCNLSDVIKFVTSWT